MYKSLSRSLWNRIYKQPNILYSIYQRIIDSCGITVDERIDGNSNSPAFHQETETDMHPTYSTATDAFREECLSSLAQIQYLESGGIIEVHNSVFIRRPSSGMRRRVERMLPRRVDPIYAWSNRPFA